MSSGWKHEKKNIRNGTKKLQEEQKMFGNKNCSICRLGAWAISCAFKVVLKLYYFNIISNFVFRLICSVLVWPFTAFYGSYGFLWIFRSPLIVTE